MDIPEVKDLSFLQSDQFYYQIFLLIFNEKDFIPEERRENYEKADSGDRIQMIIDILE